MSKTLLFQTIQFSISMQFKCKYKVYLWKTFLFQAIQFSQKVLMQIIQFSISTQFNSIWPIDRTLSGATTLSRVDLGTLGMNEYFNFPKAPALLEPHHRIVCVISRTLVGGRSSQRLTKVIVVAVDSFCLSHDHPSVVDLLLSQITFFH